ncbi:MAG: nucleoside-diphosphate sugar epimerase/dehydratase [Clostridia bacterium]|nr:nucleoside-diphosphate sugar epimerase/dehydratase [Clostridia bacterium]MDR3645870.1 nucleoside-diphosphate sugar epimerase/dehydratase [Clostridia bacterium]
MRGLKKLLAVLSQLFFDAVAAALAMFIGLSLYYLGYSTSDFTKFIENNYARNPSVYNLLLLFYIVIVLICNAIFGCYSNVWRRAGVGEFLKQIGSAVLVAAIFFALNADKQLKIPVELILTISILELLLVMALRSSVSFFSWAHAVGATFLRRSGMVRVVVFGAGEAGTNLARRLGSNPQENRRVMAFIDDDASLWGKKVMGIPVIGGRAKLADAIRSYGVHEVVIAIPTVSHETLKESLDVCHRLHCRLKRFGTIDDVNEESFSKASITDINVEDLLRRDSVRLDMEAVKGFLEHKTVLVTGGAGSIGSEICRQVLNFGAGKLVIFDISENGLYQINNELCKSFDRKRYDLVLGSIRDRLRLREVFDLYHPEVVFHAAAHKHVPMMELNPMEAIKNNLFGTINVAHEAISHDAEKFILISTDKAVNPTNIMGASKRMAEMAIQTLDRKSGTELAAVRFGNVLGSSGSVVPFFKKQIASGGPVTVTHPDMRRYFMTIPEAVQLVLEAGAMARGGEIFVLDMGDPVYIYDLACDMIRLSGFEPNRDIKIEFTGLRPGEKLFEEINLKDEHVTKTRNNKIYICKPIDIDAQRFKEILVHLDHEIATCNETGMFELVREFVPTFSDASQPGADEAAQASACNFE